MNKHLIYDYICEIETDLHDILSHNRFANLIICEIVDDAIIGLHEVDSSSLTDEETAKGFVTMSVNKFYTQNHLVKVEDKYWNYDNRLSYGYRGRILATPDNLIRFRNAVDLTRKEVVNEKDAMLHAVKNFEFKTVKMKHSPSSTLKNNFLSKSLAIIAVLFLLIICVSYALQHRYTKISGPYILDTWTKTLMHPDDNGNYIPYQKRN